MNPTFPTYTPDEARARETFLALMWVLSYPGEARNLPDSANPLQAIGEALLDLETSYFTPDSALSEQLKRTAARTLPPERAAYHFYPSLVDLSALDTTSAGSALYPDDGATLIIGCTFDPETRLTLEGPGIQGQRRIGIGAIPLEFWTKRERVSLYPMGWDVFLVDGAGKLIGLPRTTRITVGE